MLRGDVSKERELSEWRNHKFSEPLERSLYSSGDFALVWNQGWKRLRWNTNHEFSAAPLCLFLVASPISNPTSPILHEIAVPL